MSQTQHADAASEIDAIEAGPSSAPLARTVLRNLGGIQNLILLGAILLLAAILSVLNPSFLLPNNLISIGTAVTISGLLAVVQTAVMIMGGIDLTVGSVAGLSSVVSAMVFTASNAYLGILVALLMGALCGLVNAVIMSPAGCRP